MERSIFNGRTDGSPLRVATGRKRRANSAIFSRGNSKIISTNAVDRANAVERDRLIFSNDLDDPKRNLIA